MIIVLESIDSGGKGTQIAAIDHHFGYDKGWFVEKIHFPVYDTITGKLIKSMLDSGRIDPLVLQCAMVTNRLEMFDVLKKHETVFAGGKNLLLIDRYNPSAVAYGLADGLPLDFLNRIHEALPQPDHSFLLDITVEESFRRRPVRQDVYESNRERLEKARKNYLELFSTSGPSFHIVDGMLPPEEVTRQIINIIEERK